MRCFALIAACLTLAACATPMRQEALQPPVSYQGAHLTDDWFYSFDGARLGLQSWLPEGEARAVIIGVHGMTDYSETFYLAGPWWAEHGVATYAYDQRGFGRSPKRGIWPTEAVMMADLRAFADEIRARHPGKPVLLVGSSMGGAVSIAAMGSDHPPDVDRVVLASPAVWGWSQMNPFYQAALHVANGFRPGWGLTGESLERWPSDNIEMLRKLSRDPLMIRATRVDAVKGLTDLMEKAWETPVGQQVSTLIMMGEHDEIVPPGVIRKYARQRSPDACFVTYPNGWHMLLRDLQAEMVWEDVLEFIDGTCPQPPRLEPGVARR